MEKDRVEQVELQKKSHEHTRNQFAARQKAELDALVFFLITFCVVFLEKKVAFSHSIQNVKLAEHKAEIANLDKNLLAKRVELLLEQHKQTAALVYKHFKIKHEVCTLLFLSLFFFFVNVNFAFVFRIFVFLISHFQSSKGSYFNEQRTIGGSWRQFAHGR